MCISKVHINKRYNKHENKQTKRANQRGVQWTDCAVDTQVQPTSTAHPVKQWMGGIPDLLADSSVPMRSSFSGTSSNYGCARYIVLQ